MGYIGAGPTRFNTADELTVTGDAEFNGNATFGDNDKIVFGAGSDLQIYHDGSNSYIYDGGAGNLIIKATDIRIRTATDENYITATQDGALSLYYDNAAKLATTATGVDVTGVITTDGLTTSADITFGDNDKAVFGAGSDLQIYHNGSDSYVDDTGTGALILRGNANVTIGKYTGETMGFFEADGAVSLYHNNAIKLATTATGVDVTGTVTASSVGVGAAPNATFGSLLYTQGTPAANKPIVSAYSQGNSNNAGFALFNDSGNRGIWTTGSTMRFTRTYEGNSTADVTIDASGNVGIGVNPEADLHIGKSFSASAGGAKLLLKPSLAYGSIVNNDDLGQIAFGAKTNSVDNTDNDSVMIRGVADATWATNDYPTRLEFWTTSDGNADPTERMRLTGNGNLLVGTQNETGDGQGLELRGDLENGGLVQIKKSSSSVSGNRFMMFARDGSVIGSVSMSGTTAVVYNTSSDYRLKENVIADWDATTRLKQLNPVRFNFIADPNTIVDGFLAHEVQSVVPEAITGTHNEVDDEGNPVYQGIDQSKLVPLLVKTIQELEARIAILESQ